MSQSPPESNPNQTIPHEMHPSGEGSDFFLTGGIIPPVHSDAYLPKGTPIRDRYVVEQLLGEGGMGQVYLVHDNLVKTQRALKVLHPHVAEHQREQLITELKLQEQLSHEGILRTYNLDVDPALKRHFFTMEYIKGFSLQYYLDQAEKETKRPPFTTQEVSHFLQACTNALEYAHLKNIVHRDLKPSNILLPSSGGIKLVDFGIARQVTEQAMHTGHVGTAIYVAPEQLRGGSKVSPQADIYSMGVILYQMLTGELFYGRMPGPSKLLAEYGKPNAVPHTVDDVLFKALAAFPNQRYASMRSFEQAFMQALIGIPDETDPTQSSQGKPSRFRYSLPEHNTSKKEESSSFTASRTKNSALKYRSLRSPATYMDDVRPSSKPPGIWGRYGWGAVGGISSGILVTIVGSILETIFYLFTSTHAFSHRGSILSWILSASFIGIGGGIILSQMVHKIQTPNQLKLRAIWVGTMGGIIGAMAVPGHDELGMGMALLGMVLAVYYDAHKWTQKLSPQLKWTLFGLFLGFLFTILENSVWFVRSTLSMGLTAMWLSFWTGHLFSLSPTSKLQPQD